MHIYFGYYHLHNNLLRKDQHCVQKFKSVNYIYKWYGVCDHHHVCIYLGMHLESDKS